MCEYIKVNPNPRVEKLFGFEAYCKWMGITKPNANSLTSYNSGDVKGRFIEAVLEQTEGTSGKITENQNTPYFDLIRNGKKVESKSTSTNVTSPSQQKYNTNYLQIGGLLSKKYGCDEIIITDAVNFRWFCIPHDDFFNKFKLIDVWKNQSELIDYRLVWFTDYNPNKYFKNGNYRSPYLSHNTKLITNYEVF